MGTNTETAAADNTVQAAAVMAEGASEATETATGAPTVTADAAAPLMGHEPAAESEKKTDPAGGKQPETPVEPVDYKAGLKLPDGVALDEKGLETAAALFKENNLPLDQAQKYIDMYCGLQKQQAEQAQTTHKTTIEGWVNEIQGRPEFAAELPTVRRGIAGLTKDYPELRELYNDPVFGNMPQLWKIALCFGKRFETEASMVSGGRDNGEKKPLAETLYTSMNTQN